jgi:hypothetical protein
MAPYLKIVKYYNVTFCNNKGVDSSHLKNRRILNFETAPNKNARFPERKKGAVGSDHGYSGWIMANKQKLFQNCRLCSRPPQEKRIA